MWKVGSMLSNMESILEHPTAAEASAALSDAEASRATLAHRLATPSWFFTSISAAIAAQIATSAVIRDRCSTPSGARDEAPTAS